MSATSDYVDELVLMKSLLIVTSLQKRRDVRAAKAVARYEDDLDWTRYGDLMIDDAVWKYAVEKKRYKPQTVFCHPDLLAALPETSLYYRGLCGISLKAAKKFCSGVDKMETGRLRNPLDSDKALRTARAYNTWPQETPSPTASNGHLLRHKPSGPV